jgi:predicted metal-dependent peptidase
MASNKKKNSNRTDIATENFEKGCSIVRQHPMFGHFLYYVNIIRREGNLCPHQNWAVISDRGYIHVHPTRRGSPEEWAYVIAHCLLHLGFDHFQQKLQPKAWNAACDRFIANFLENLQIGEPPQEYLFSLDISASNEESFYQEFCDRGIPTNYCPDLIIESSKYWIKTDWQKIFGEGLTQAVTDAVNIAGGKSFNSEQNDTPAKKAKSWFINSYPLLGALATSFEIIEDPLVCHRLDISVAAVDTANKEIFVNPASGLNEKECLFGMAHELLHVGLRHDLRRQGRDPYFWNVACDYVINEWLVEMKVGELPAVGGLYDPELKGLSAEEIYDRIVTDLRRYRKLATMRGIGQSDILERDRSGWWNSLDGITLDDFYRRCLSQELIYHNEQNRGLLPAELIQEIRTLSQPPIPWDVELAKWFDNYFSPLVKIRSYARPSRRQSSTPDIPRPRYISDPDAKEGRTFGVVLDTSGSMDRELLGKALGAIASYSISREVASVRLVFCDAMVYDKGYVSPESIADRVEVKGRGGAVWQPGIDLLEKAKDFPKDAPVLVITDGYCDRLQIFREHAFLIPIGQRLPFIPKGKVFRIR